MNQRFIEALEKKTGESLRSMQETPIDVRREKYEKRTGKNLKFVSFFPLIGRGNVTRNRPDREEIEEKLDKILD